jgi:hypothetical protein
VRIVLHSRARIGAFVIEGKVAVCLLPNKFFRNSFLTVLDSDRSRISMARGREGRHHLVGREILLLVCGGRMEMYTEPRLIFDPAVQG